MAKVGNDGPYRVPRYPNLWRLYFISHQMAPARLDLREPITESGNNKGSINIIKVINMRVLVRSVFLCFLIKKTTMISTAR